MISLAPGVVNPPPNSTSIVPETAVADKAQLTSSADFNGILAATAAAQGFTAGHNWIYSFNAAELPAGIVNPVALPANADFHITAYNLFLNPAMTKFGETMDFTLNNPPPDPVLGGATITEHWLQLLHEDKQYGGFGFAIAGQTGFWQLDNGDVAWSMAGNGPFYDSNGMGFSVPPTFHDAPQFYSGQGTYVHFTTIPSWDISVGGKNYIIVGNQGLSWGFVIVPEPSTLGMACVGVLLIALIVHRRGPSWFGGQSGQSWSTLDGVLPKPASVSQKGS